MKTSHHCLATLAASSACLLFICVGCDHKSPAAETQASSVAPPKPPAPAQQTLPSNAGPGATTLGPATSASLPASTPG
jgi:hypothetical protein